MSGARLLILVAVAACFIAAAAVVIGNQNSKVAADSGTMEPVAPGLSQKINEIRRLNVSTGKAKTDITRSEGESWRIDQLSGYPADVQKIRQFLYKLGASKKAEKKTADPELFYHIALDDASSVRVQGFAADGGDPVFDTMIGTYDATFHGTFVRTHGENQSWLASERIEVNAEPLFWVNDVILNVERSRIWKLELLHEGEPKVEITRDRPAGDFVLQNIPQGKELKGTYDIYTIATALEGMQLSNVAKAQTLPDPVKTTAKFQTIDGLEITVAIAPGAAPGTHWAKVSARFVPEAVMNTEEAKKIGKPEEDVKKEALAITERTKDWIYILGEFPYGLMTRTMEDVTKPLKQAVDPQKK